MCRNRRWIELTLSHRETKSIPYNFGFTPPARRLLEKHYGRADLEDALDLPIRFANPKSIKPLYASPTQHGETITDEFGVTWTTSHVDRGAPTGPCLPEPDLTRYEFPDPAAPYRYEDLGDWCQSNREHYTLIWVGDLWERATFVRGMENILLDLVLHPRFVEELLRGIADYNLRTMEILFERFSFDGIAVSDDYGDQKSMLMSPRHWRRFLKPLLAEIYAFAKSRSRTVLHHSCGNIHPIVADMVELGLDVLHPVQPEAMDIVRLKREYGHYLTLWGGLRTQDLLPRGTPEEVRTEVRRLKREMGVGGGYILAPGITIQADVPLRNLVAMIDEVTENNLSATDPSSL